MNGDPRPSVSAQDIGSDAAPEQTSRLVPIELEALMQDRPLLAFESAQRYDDLHAQMMAHFAPQDAVEFILVKDLTDAQWDANRARRMREAAIDAALPELAWFSLGGRYMKAYGPPLPAPLEDDAPEDDAMDQADDADEDDLQDEVQRILDLDRAREERESRARCDFMDMMRRARKGDPEMRARLETLMEGAGLTYDMLYQSALRQSLKSMSALEDTMSRAQTRRDQVMRMIEERRRTSQAMSRALLQSRDRASVEDVPFRAGRR